jgi:polar amino acid transport system substrate-binding protein
MRRTIVLAVVAGLAAAGCGAKAQNPSPGPSGSAAADRCATQNLHLVHPGRLTIGTSNPAYPPYFEGGHPKGSDWKLNDPHTGKGFESAVAYAVAAQLGFSKDAVDWAVSPFNQSYAPGPKNWDFNIQQISYNPKRAQAVDFSDSYYDESEALVAVKGTPIASATNISDLQSYKLAAPLGTTSYDIITDVIKPTKEPGGYQSLSDAVAALNAHAVDGIIVDYPTALYIADPYVQEAKNSVVVGQFPATAQSEHFGMTFVKGNPLRACVNEALAALKASGKLQAITTEWLSKKTNVGEVPVFSQS